MRDRPAVQSSFLRLPLRGVAGRPAAIFGAGLLTAIVTVALLAPMLATADPYSLAGPSLAPPAPAHLMGTDVLGRDLYSGLLYATRASLLIAAATGLLASVCGLSVGVVAGYHGGIIDDLLMRFTELFQVLPRFILVTVIIALLGPGIDRVVLTLGLTSWPVLARVVRGEVLATRSLEFVLSAEALGATRLRIFWRVLIPQVLPSVLVIVGLTLGQVLLLEASLGFLGLGDPNTLTWGMLAGQAQGYLRAAWWLPLFPGLAITFTVLGFNLLADGLSAMIQRR